jgi:hypothetical protein
MQMEARIIPFVLLTNSRETGHPMISPSSLPAKAQRSKLHRRIRLEIPDHPDPPHHQVSEQTAPDHPTIPFVLLTKPCEPWLEFLCGKNTPRSG